MAELSNNTERKNMTFRDRVQQLISRNVARSLRYSNEFHTWNRDARTSLRTVVEELVPLGVTIFRKMKKDPKSILEIHNEVDGTNSKISATLMSQRINNCYSNMLIYEMCTGDVVAIISNMAKDVTPIFIACLQIGAIFVPCPPDLDEENLRKLLEELKPNAVFFDDRFKRKVLSAVNRDNLKICFTLGNENDSVSRTLLNRPKTYLPFPDSGFEHGQLIACKICSSSGKLLSFTQIQLRKAMKDWDSLHRDDIVLVGCTICKINHLTLILKTLVDGITRIETGFAVNEEVYCGIIKNQKVTRFYSCVSMIWEMINLSQKNKDYENCLNSLRMIITFDEFFPTKLQSRIDFLIPKCRVSSTFSVTEAAGVLASSNTLLNKKVINGGTIRNTMFYKIVDGNMMPLRIDEDGQLCVKYIRGHQFIPDDSDELVISERYVTNDNWLVTGHYARLNKTGILQVFGKYSRNILCDGVLVSIDEYLLIKIYSVCLWEEMHPILTKFGPLWLTIGYNFNVNLYIIYI